jgi:hypothetical protein
MAFDYLTNFLLIQPKPGDSEETRQQKEVINHAIQTYFQFSAAEKVADNLLSQFVPRQVLLSRVSDEPVTGEDARLNVLGGGSTIGLLRFLAGSKRLPIF